jgi:hypothetical protein
MIPDNKPHTLPKPLLPDEEGSFFYIQKAINNKI